MDEHNEKRVLVIGCTADSAGVQALADVGYTVETVETLDEAREKLGLRAFALVLADSAMLAELAYAKGKVAPPSEEDELHKWIIALQESEEMYRNLVERSNDGVVVLQDTLIKFVNPRFCELSGYRAETLVGTIFTNYLTPEEIILLYKRYQQRMAGEPVPSIYETVMTRSDGSKITLEISAAVVSFQGRPADLVLIRDIRERKRAEEYLQRYRILSENARDLLIFAGLDGRILEVNRTAVEAYGYSHEELLSMNLADLRIEEERAEICNQLKHAQVESILFETVDRRRDGSTFPVEVSFSGAVIQDKPMLLGIIRDITRRKRIEEALDVERRRLGSLLEELELSRSEVQKALERERYFSLLLQRALLPAEPSIGEGYSVAVRYVPVFVEREIGGDFFDVFTTRAGWAGVLIGDVSGKGLEAASLAAITRATVHAFVHETSLAGEALSRANAVLCSQKLDIESFVTVSLVIIDLATGDICHAPAGHPPGVILRADGTVEFLPFANLPLWIIDSSDYQQFSAHLDFGDKLLLYTDGISEAHNGAMFDLEGIQRTLDGHGDWTAEEIAEQLTSAATEWAEGKLRDDAAVVVVGRTVKTPP